MKVQLILVLYSTFQLKHYMILAMISLAVSKNQ